MKELDMRLVPWGSTEPPPCNACERPATARLKIGGRDLRLLDLCDGCVGVLGAMLAVWPDTKLAVKRGNPWG